MRSLLCHSFRLFAAVRPEVQLAWTLIDGQGKFQNLIQTLNSHFNVYFLASNEANKWKSIFRRFTCQLTNQSLQFVLTEIRLILDKILSNVSQKSKIIIISWTSLILHIDLQRETLEIVNMWWFFSKVAVFWGHPIGMHHCKTCRKLSTSLHVGSISSRTASRWSKNEQVLEWIS